MPTPQPPPWLALDPRVAKRLEMAFVVAAQRPAQSFQLDLAGLPAVPAALMRWVLVDALPASDGHVARAAFWHASVADMLWLRGLVVGVTPAFVQCDLAGIDVTDARLPGLEVIGGRIGVLRADRVRIEGSLLMRGHIGDRTFHHRLPDDAQPSIAVSGGALLCGAAIRGNLDLRGAQIGPLPPIGSDTVALSGDGVSVQGNALLGQGFAADGEVRLNGCAVTRDLDLSGAQLANAHGLCLSAVSAQVKGRLRLCRDSDNTPLRSQGAVVLTDARIDSDLDAGGAELTAAAFVDEAHWAPHAAGAAWHARAALFAGGCSIGGSLSLSGCVARGQVWVTRCHVGNHLDLQESSFHFPGEPALLADGIEVAGFTYLIGTRTNGLLTFLAARLNGGCACLRLRLSLHEPWRNWPGGSFIAGELGDNACGVYFAAAEIKVTLVWREVARDDAPLATAVAATPRTPWFAAQSATLTELDDDLASWVAVERVNLTDCSYTRIETLGRPLDDSAQALGRLFPAGAADTTWRLAVLDREYAAPGVHRQEAILRFSPTPYLQLARAYQRAGLVAAARKVLLRLERNRTRYSGLARWRIGIRRLLDFFVCYGLEPLRLLPIVLVWALASGILFKWLHDLHRMQPVGHEPPRFNWFFYGLDTLVPFVDFGQKKAWAITDLFSPGGVLLLFNALFGYVLIGILGGVVSGVVRSGKDAG